MRATLLILTSLVVQLPALDSVAQTLDENPGQLETKQRQSVREALPGSTLPAEPAERRAVFEAIAVAGIGCGSSPPTADRLARVAVDVGSKDGRTNALEDLALTEANLPLHELRLIVEILAQRERWGTIQVVYDRAEQLARRARRRSARALSAEEAKVAHVLNDAEKESVIQGDAYVLRSAIIGAAHVAHTNGARALLDYVIQKEKSDLREDAVRYTGTW